MPHLISLSAFWASARRYPQCSPAFRINTTGKWLVIYPIYIYIHIYIYLQEYFDKVNIRLWPILNYSWNRSNLAFWSFWIQTSKGWSFRLLWVTCFRPGNHREPEQEATASGACTTAWFNSAQSWCACTKRWIFGEDLSLKSSLSVHFTCAALKQLLKIQDWSNQR